MSQAGIVYTPHGTSAQYLPLNSLTAHIFIADVSARVVLSQVYSHAGSDTLPEVYYVFPVPARAAVCSFEMQTDDGVSLTGIVKTLAQAREDYEKALEEDRLAGLLEQMRGDVFVLSIGSMYPRSLITVTISYVVDLSEDDQIDTIRFQLSSHVGARYGAPATSVLSYGTAHDAALSITVDIEMPGPILDVSSIHHTLQDITPTNPPVTPRIDSVTGLPSTAHFARKKFTSSSANLGQDFLLIVRALGLDRPRCFMEYATYRQRPSTAMALTIVPRFQPKPTTRSDQEYVFLIDRSGSMLGNKIVMARQALSLFLKCLSTAGTWFNIYSFGTNFSSLWWQSLQYNNASLHEAEFHTNRMEADMGGTELLNAITHVIATRKNTVPTNVFILTDGWFSDSDAVIDCIKRAVDSASPLAPFRVFTLGVGDGASTELCEGMATAGNGACSMTLEGENLMRKSMLLFNAMEAPKVEELSIDWGTNGQSKYHQVPYPSVTLFPDQRLLVTTILPIHHVPTHVTLRGRLSDNTPLFYEVPVQHISSIRSTNIKKVIGRSIKLPRLIHTLAAHRLIAALEKGRALRSDGSSTPNTRRNKLIENLSVRYQVASSRTAFVAIANLDPPSVDSTESGSEYMSATSQPDNGSDMNAGNSANPPTGTPQKSGAGSDSDARENPTTTLSHESHGEEESKAAETSHSSTHTEKQDSYPSPQVPGAFQNSWTRNTPFGYFTEITTQTRNAAWEFLTVCNPLGEGHPRSIFMAPPLLQDIVIVTWVKSLWSRVFRGGRTDSHGASQSPRNRSGFPIVEDAAFIKYFEQLFPLQSLDGSFPDLSQVALITGVSESQLQNSLPAQAQVYANPNVLWATAIAIASLRKRFALHAGLWGKFEAKAVEYGSGICGRDEFEKIIQLALVLV